MKQIIILIAVTLLIFNSRIHSQSFPNNVCSFNGFYSYANLGNYITPTSAVTLEAWVYPRQIESITMCVIGKNYLTGMFLGIQASGRIVFYPKGGVSFRSRVSGTVPAGQWTHIAATYNGSLTSIYINGVLDTSTTAITGSPTPNNDTLYLGADRIGIDNLFFYGYMDNIRIWSTARTAAEIRDCKSIPYNFIYPTGIYASLEKNIQFNNDFSNYAGRDLTLINFSDKAVNISDYNNSLVLNGTTDYCSHTNDNHWFDLQSSFTMEAWVKRDTTGTQPLFQNVINKSGGTSGVDYGIYFSSTGDLYFAINNFSYILQAPGVMTSAQWTHLAASYYPATGKAILYCNGDSVAGTIFPGFPVVSNNPYKMYFGGVGASNNAANKFKGQLDDIKIWYISARSGKQIKESMFTNNIRFMGSADSVVYLTFDRFSNGFHLGASSHTGGLIYYGNAHISSSHADIINNSTSPVISDPLMQFNSSSSTMSYRKFFVPDGDPAGITDSIYISEGNPVSDLRVCLLMSHSYTRDVDILLIAPSGSSVYLLEKNGGTANDVMTIFSDAADSIASFGTKVNGPGINSPFSPMIRANQSLSSMLNGQNRKGWWKLRIIDYATPDVGYVLGWGLNMKSQRNLKLTAFIEGFYNSATNKMIPDTAKVYLRNSTTPFSLIDSARSILDSNGRGSFYFNKAVNSAAYFIVMKHRNSVETWSSSGISFTSDTAVYDFSTASSRAYGNNQKLIDSAPIKYGVYGGDISMDGNVNLADITEVYNDAAGFVNGYVKSDVTGDRIVNLTDLILVYNNSQNFIALRRP